MPPSDWDSFSAYLVKEVKHYLHEGKTDAAVIPGDLTSVLQPLDVSINKPFKRWALISNNIIVKGFKKNGNSSELSISEDNVLWQESDGEPSNAEDIDDLRHNFVRLVNNMAARQDAKVSPECKLSVSFPLVLSPWSWDSREDYKMWLLKLAAQKKLTKMMYDFWLHHKELTISQKQRCGNTKGNEVSLYLSTPVCLKLKVNPLEEWEVLKTAFPLLYKQARLIVATSVACERLFSIAGATITSRNCLTGKHLEKHIHMKSPRVQKGMRERERERERGGREGGGRRREGGREGEREGEGEGEREGEREERGRGEREGEREGGERGRERGREGEGEGGRGRERGEGGRGREGEGERHSASPASISTSQAMIGSGSHLTTSVESTFPWDDAGGSCTPGAGDAVLVRFAG
ncbi:hypothetical protein PR048_026643 [Dryococelus australis]|uniref:HAT C-terminal dimerisation domain-containing protein n=1 Tax=Dryococelus australis TaxID=614101 RepID=A0ABQ9GLY7_9NEOP|nr:hypothetical protein PR048_026643 [Dryococelus australis]